MRFRGPRALTTLIQAVIRYNSNSKPYWLCFLILQAKTLHPDSGLRALTKVVWNLNCLLLFVLCVCVRSSVLVCWVFLAFTAKGFTVGNGMERRARVMKAVLKM